MTKPDPRPIARRVLEVRRDLFGEEGGPALAEELGLPWPTLRNYEAGVAIPAHVLLEFLRATGAHPSWLLDGRGPKYLRARDETRAGRRPVDVP